VLDGHVPPLAELVAFARRLAAQPGVIYLHCAQGHGRSALVAACVLIARGAADGPDDAMRIIRAARPRVRLTRGQADLLRRAAAELAQAR
jgi:protein-tyrosine phosphatase